MRTRQPTLVGFALGADDDASKPPTDSPAAEVAPPSVPKPSLPRPRSSGDAPKPTPPAPPAARKPVAAKPPPPPPRSFPKPASSISAVHPTAPKADAAKTDAPQVVAPRAVAPRADAPKADPSEQDLSDEMELSEDPLDEATRPATFSMGDDPSGEGGVELRTAIDAAAFPDDDDDDEVVEDLPGESTQVAVTAIDSETDPSVETSIPYAMDATRPSVSMPDEPEPELPPVSPLDAAPPGPRRSPRATDPSAPLAVEPTRVVSGDARKDAPQTFSYDPHSGRLEATDETPRRRTSGAMWGILAVALVVGLSGLGFLAWAIVVTKTADDPPAATDDPEPEATLPPDDDAPVAAVEGTEATVAETAPGETETSGDEGAPEGEDSDSETPEQGERVEVEAFDLRLPRLSRRARGMDEPTRRRQNTRWRAQALRSYAAGEFEDAERQFRTAMGFNTWDVASVEGLARATARQGRFDEAVAWAQLAVDRNPGSAIAYRVLGDVWRQAGHPDEALDAYRRGLAREPEDRWLRQRVRDVGGDE